MSQEIIPFYNLDPQTLGHYLTALGVFRLVSKFLDKNAKARWSPHFEIQTTISRQALYDFLLKEWQPAPLVHPWNKSCGFYGGDGRNFVQLMRNSEASRFARYRQTLNECAELTSGIKIEQLKQAAKVDFIRRCYNNLSDPELVEWFLCVFAILTDRVENNPILGQLGCDGKLEFANRYMGNLIELFDLKTGDAKPKAQSALFSLLEEIPVPSTLTKTKIGRFNPLRAGGIGNSFASGKHLSEATTNLWELPLILQGLFFCSSSSTQQLGNPANAPANALFPFVFRLSPGLYSVGLNELIESMLSGGEFWAPLWKPFLSGPELYHFFRKNSVIASERKVSTGAQFLTAMPSLEAVNFVRFAFLQRNGRSYSAVGTTVKPTGWQNKMPQIGEWLESWQEAYRSKGFPQNLYEGLQQFESAFMEARSPLEVIVALGRFEATQNRSLTATIEVQKKYRVLPLRLPEAIRELCDDGSLEYYLANVLSSRPNFRQRLVQTRFNPKQSRLEWSEVDKPLSCWGSFSLEQNLLHLIQREQIERKRCDSPPFVYRQAIAAYIYGYADSERIEEIARGLAIAKPTQYVEPPKNLPTLELPFVYNLLALALYPNKIQDVSIPIEPQIIAKLLQRDVDAASRIAVRRLRGSGFSPLIEGGDVPEDWVDRLGASLAFPLASSTATNLLKQSTKQKEEEIYV